MSLQKPPPNPLPVAGTVAVTNSDIATMQADIALIKAKAEAVGGMPVSEKSPLSEIKINNTSGDPVPVAEQNVPTNVADYSGTTSATPEEVTTITKPTGALGLYFLNKDLSNSLLVSLDGGDTWVAEVHGGLAPAEKIEPDFCPDSIKVKSLSASVKYICLIAVKA